MTAEGLNPGDPSSFARPDEAEVSSVNLYLDVNFERKILCRKVGLTIDKKKAEVTHVG
jgi:hypothetical protein